MNAPQLLTLGGHLNLNTATAEQLLAVPNLGGEVAKALVDVRKSRGPYHTWDEVDAVHGVGPARVEILKQYTEIALPDASL